MWTVEDNSRSPSTPSPALPLSRPHRVWIALCLSTCIPSLSTGSSTATAQPPGRQAELLFKHPPVAPYIPTTYPQVRPVIHIVIHHSLCGFHALVRWLTALKAPLVIYTGGHFSTRMGYLSTFVTRRAAFSACVSRLKQAPTHACLFPPGARNRTHALQLSTHRVDNPPQMWMVDCGCFLLWAAGWGFSACLSRRQDYHIM